MNKPKDMRLIRRLENGILTLEKLKEQEGGLSEREEGKREVLISLYSECIEHTDYVYEIWNWQDDIKHQATPFILDNRKYSKKAL
jgi:hypothetical protein